MSKVVNFQRQDSRRAGAIPAIPAAMGIAGAAGYLGPSLVKKLPLPNHAQLAALGGAEAVADHASVIDGDTIEIRGGRSGSGRAST